MVENERIREGERQRDRPNLSPQPVISAGMTWIMNPRQSSLGTQKTGRHNGGLVSDTDPRTKPTIIKITCWLVWKRLITETTMMNTYCCSRVSVQKVSKERRLKTTAICLWRVKLLNGACPATAVGQRQSCLSSELLSQGSRRWGQGRVFAPQPLIDKQ